MAATQAIGTALILAASLSASTGPASGAGTTTWSAVGPESRIVVNVYKKGLLSGMAHDHRFVAGDFRVSATTDGTGPAPILVHCQLARSRFGAITCRCLPQ